jgi:Flp pilus assembly protein TadB
MPMALVVASLVLGAVLLGWPSAEGRLLRLTSASAALLSVDEVFHRGRRIESTLSQDVGAALVIELVAAALAAGAPPPQAMETVGIAVQGASGGSMCEIATRLRLGSEWDLAWRDAPRRLEPLRRTLLLASRTGAPASALLRDAAEDLRRRDSREAQAAAGRLGVRMVLPLGLCSLPAFVAWAVVPVVISLAGRVLEG